MASAKLNDGNEIPIIGLGVYQSGVGSETVAAVKNAIELGYTHIDTARFYGNEEDCLSGIKAAGVDRDEIFITTKLRPQDFTNAAHAIAESAERLGGSIDLLLLHCPSNDRAARFKAWQDMERAVADGVVKSIGVSNFGVAHMEGLEKVAKIQPCLNQLELHPWLQQRAIVEHCEAKGIVVEAYSPLAKAQKMDEPVLVEISRRLQVEPAQVLVRWSLDKKFVTLPKSVTADRQRANKDVFGFELSADDIARLDSLECNFATGWTPQIDHAV
jgi:diketogulonate reductase-like aldo/keto reductase